MDSKKNAAGLDQFNDGRMIWYPPVRQDVLIPDKPVHQPQKSNSCTLVPAHGYYIIGNVNLWSVIWNHMRNKHDLVFI